MSPLRQHLTGILPLGFGVSGPLATPLLSARQCERLVKAALDSGVCIFDTGPSYGHGEAERRLGKALHGAPDAFVMTKAGVLAAGRTRNFAPEAIAQSVEASLRRLDREIIDLLWLHGPATHELTDTLIAQLMQLRTDGKVRHFGVAGRNDHLLAITDHSLFEAVMLPVHKGLALEDIARLKTLRAGGHLICAIEALTGLKRRPMMLTRATAWRQAKRLAGRGGSAAGLVVRSVEEAFSHAFQQGADMVISTSTHPGHIRQNADICRGLLSS